MNKRIGTIFALAILIGVFAGCSNKDTSLNENIPFGYEDGAECMKKKDYDCAIKEFNNQLVLAENAVGFNLLGMAYRHRFNETGDQLLKDKEIDAFVNAVDMDGEFLVAIKNLGYTYYNEGLIKDAGDMMRRALELNPNDPEADKMKEIVEESKKQI